MPVSSDSPSNPKVFHGQEALVKIGDTFTVNDSDDLLTQLDAGSSQEFSAELTEITITDPEASLEVQNTFGGQIITESPSDLVEIEFSARFKDLELMEQLHGNTTSVAAGSFQRISGTRSVGNKRQRAILFKVQKTVDGTDYIIHYLLNNAIFQQMGEISLAADGTAELSGTAMCLVEDRHVEDNFS